MPDGHPPEDHISRDPDFEDITMRGLGEGPAAPVKLKHPAGLRVLFMCEMWERFSFYGMKALLVLYLIKSSGEGGLEWSKEHAGTLMGWYAGLVYLTPLVGGYLADRWLGTHRSLVIGGAIIAAGHFTLMGDTIPTLFIGLSLVIIGTGFFKSNVSTMVGQLYKPGDGRRDAGFTIFYMGINLGAFLAPLVCGWLRTRFGWNWGFGAAGVGMVLGLLQYMHGRPKHLVGIGDPPSLDQTTMSFCAACAHDMHEEPEDAPCPECGETGRVPLAREVPLTREDRHRMAVIFIMAFFVVFFWTAFEQAGTSMAFFAEERTDRTAPAYLEWAVGEKGETTEDGTKLMPAEWFQSLNPLFILIFAPVVASIWVRLARLKKEPSTPLKMGLGLILLGLSFLFMVGAATASEGQLAAPWWLVSAFFVMTMGELCLSPVGLSLVTKLAPIKFASLLMGVWFLANFVANLTAGLVAGQVDKISDTGFILPGWAGFYLIFVIAPIAAGLLVLMLSPVLRKLMHGRG
jgi:POT family proton-dependent oligopeptide transporter